MSEQAKQGKQEGQQKPKFKEYGHLNKASDSF